MMREGREAEMKHADTPSPVSFKANVGRLPHKGLPVVIDANAEQRAALAAEHALLSVENYRAELQVAPWKRNGVKVSGRVEADITQACIVTLEPITAHIDEEVEALFLPEQSKLGREASKVAVRFCSTPTGQTARKPFPATRSMSGRSPNSSSGWRSIPTHASPAPRSRPPARISPSRTNSSKSCDPCLENPKHDAIGEKSVVRQPKTAIFAEPSRAPLFREFRISRAMCPGPS